jgi:hypothetical protein
MGLPSNQRALRIVAIVAIVIAKTEDVRSCTCIMPPPPAQAFAQADAVYLGKIISFEPDSVNGWVAKIDVLRLWKGDKDAADELFTSSGSATCGYYFQVGQTYVVYAYKSANGRLRTSICTRTNPIQLAAEDLKFLDSFSYQPLSLGNSWRFAHDFSESIIDTTRIDGHLYYRFDSFGGGKLYKNVRMRMTDTQELVVRTDTTDQMWLDFAADVGQSWNVRDSEGLAEWTVLVESITDTVKVPAGEFVQCRRFYFQFNGADNDWVEWYAPNIGPVKRDLHGIAFIEYPLQDAVINGTNFPTSVPHQHNTVPAKTFDLAQNYPNPFSLKEALSLGTATVIAYRLNSEGKVALTIYDVLGREIKKLVNRSVPRGDHRVLWDGTNSRGGKVTAGTYFYRFEAGGFAEVRKLVLLR